VTRHSTTTVTEASYWSLYIGNPTDADSWGAFDTTQAAGYQVVPSRSGTTPTYTLFDIEVKPYDGPGVGILVGGQYAFLVDTWNDVQDGDDPPNDDYWSGDLYAATTSADGFYKHWVAYTWDRAVGNWCAVRLSSTLGFLVYADADAVGITEGVGDTTLQIIPVREYVDTTGADDVTSIMSNYLGGAVLQQYLLDNDSYLALLTASPTALGSMAGEVVGGDYERPLCVWSAPGSKTTGLGALSIANMPACTVSWVAVMDAPTGGNMLFAKELPVPVVVASSSEWRMAANTIVITL
jgi:hypothetical protein